MRKCCNTETIYSGFDFGKVSVSVSVPDWFQIQTILSIFFIQNLALLFFIIRSSINAQTRAFNFFLFFTGKILYCVFKLLSFDYGSASDPNPVGTLQFDHSWEYGQRTYYLHISAHCWHTYSYFFSLT